MHLKLERLCSRGIVPLSDYIDIKSLYFLTCQIFQQITLKITVLTLSHRLFGFGMPFLPLRDQQFYLNSTYPVLVFFYLSPSLCEMIQQYHVRGKVTELMTYEARKRKQLSVTGICQVLKIHTYIEYGDEAGKESSFRSRVRQDTYTWYKDRKEIVLGHRYISSTQACLKVDLINSLLNL